MPEPLDAKSILLECPGCGTLILLGSTWQRADCCESSRVEYRVTEGARAIFINTRVAPTPDQAEPPDA